MKVYGCPDAIPAPKIDYANYNFEREREQEEAHRAQLKAWLVSAGYTGKLTGEIVSFPVADGRAQYMFADGRKCCLIHLPYGDAWDYRDVSFLPRAEIVKRINSEKKMTEIFARKEKA